MPTISMFFGILISIFYGDDEQHHTPLLHARYQGKSAADWELAVAGEEPFRIAPLQ